MTIDPKSELALSYRKARAFTGYRCTAATALSNARRALQKVAEARAAHDEVQGAAVDYTAPGPIPADSPAAVVTRRALVDAKAAAGLFGRGDELNGRPYVGTRNGNRFYASRADVGGAFRGVRDADDIAPRLGRWFTNPDGESSRDGSGLCWGVVVQLSGKDGAPRFLAGWQDGGTDAGPAVDLSPVFTDEEDAARYADGMAERVAEDAREYELREREELEDEEYA